MSDELREQIRNSLNQKDLYELLEIWRINNRVVWSDTTFEVLKEILKERIREIPQQEDPILTSGESGKEDNGRFEDWEVNLLDSDRQPELYDPLDVIVFRKNVNGLIIATTVVYVLLALLNIQFVRMYLSGDQISFNDVILALPNIIVTGLSTLLQIVFTYFSLKALVHILKILMEMEFNSRN